MSSTRLSYCADQVRRQDRERYLTALFAPAGRREDLFALYAFNLEVAKTAEVVSEAMVGRIRLQWWREAIEEIEEAVAYATGEDDIMGEERIPLIGRAAEVYEIITADEAVEEER